MLAPTLPHPNAGALNNWGPYIALAVPAIISYCVEGWACEVLIFFAGALEPPVAQFSKQAPSCSSLSTLGARTSPTPPQTNPLRPMTCSCLLRPHAMPCHILRHSTCCVGSQAPYPMPRLRWASPA